MKYDALVAEDIAAYIAATKKSTTQYDAPEQQSIHAFLQQLEVADYLQAQLVVQGYVLCGGTNISAIVPAARAVQMTHTYAEMLIAGHSTIAAVGGLHAAEIILANLSIDEELRLKAVSITNRALLLYAHALTAKTQTDHVQHCYATELVLNPLHVGMVLAGADCAETDAITPFALAWGRAIRTDDGMDKKDAETAFEAMITWPSAILRPLHDLYRVSLQSL